MQQSWQSLQFMIDFTRTAANTPLCWWGHEMMRSGPKVSDGAELFTRTNQFGAWSPIFTSWGNVYENNLWWDMQEPFASAMRESLKDRQQLLPYRYSAAATAHSTGLCSHRGMHVSATTHPTSNSTTGACSHFFSSRIHSNPTRIALLASSSSATTSLLPPLSPPCKTRPFLPRAALLEVSSACPSGCPPLPMPGLILTRLPRLPSRLDGCCTMPPYSQFLCWRVPAR